MIILQFMFNYVNDPLKDSQRIIIYKYRKIAVWSKHFLFYQSWWKLIFFTLVESQINNEASHVSAVDQLVRAVGKTERFIYDELKQSVNIARSHGGVPLKPEITQVRF